MHALTSEVVLEPMVLARLRHQRVAMLASAEVLRRTRHPRAAQQLLAAAEDLAVEIESVEAGGDPRRRACLVCGCTQKRACLGGCVWVGAPTGVDLCSRCAAVVDPRNPPAGCASDLRSVLDPDEAGL
ncbi:MULTISPECIES: hypothetical protein [Intrasporangiaceae]|uniref:hypothetical protein n=1 Tax=Intrasporangiaceae TaxID=85021 RepID=UPI000702F7FA|nr:MULTISPECIES: hypothetical protein [Intrasporangiaceae]KQU67373.1 hypothetical protein ASC58_12355 [Phycicoccus sp. Root101]